MSSVSRCLLKTVPSVLLFLASLMVSAQTFTFMSYNIRYDNPLDGENAWMNRKDLLIKQVKDILPDVLGIQEGLSHQVELMQDSLRNYGMYGLGRDDGATEGEYCAIFYNKEVFTLADSGTFWLSETPEKPSRGWDAALNRICTYVSLYNPTDGIRCLVLNTHFDHQGTKAREESAKLILEKISEINVNDLPVVIMGDMNAGPEEAPIQIFRKKYADTRTNGVYRAEGPEATFNAFDAQSNPEKRIDYIFVTRTAKVIRNTTIDARPQGRFISDHFPVVAELFFKP